MDELEILKKDWKKREHSFNQLTETDIYKMLHKRSSSIVKWILIISILEFLLLRLLDISVFFDEKYIVWMQQHHLYDFEKVVTIFNFCVLLIFIFFFYRNFKSISVASSVKKLMNDILNSRKILKYYVWYNLILIGISSCIVIVSEFKYNIEIKDLFNKYTFIFIIGAIFFIGVILSIFWLFYKLLYGILLKRLNNNYKELQKLDL